MNIKRTFHVFALDVRHQIRRPMVLAMIFMAGLLIWSLSTGNVKLLTSGSSMVGGTKSWLTSEAAVSQILAVTTSLIYGFFVAIGAGMTVLREEQLNVGELLRATPLEDSEYVWGKFSALLTGFGFALAAHLALMLFFFHGPGSTGREHFLGPLVGRNYLVPMLIFAVPNIVFVAGISFALGYWTRRAIVVYFFPIFLGTTTFFLFWTYSPNWLDPRINRLLMWLDPTGNRWLLETWFKVDRGADFYNTAVLDHDFPFLLSRLMIVGVALLAVASCHSVRLRALVPSFLKGARPAEGLGGISGAAGSGRGDRFAEIPPSPPLGKGGTRVGIGTGTGILRVARVELRELRSNPGLYLFIPLLVIQTLLNALLTTGFFQTPVLLTSGWLAVFEINFLTVWLCPLLLIYAVESMERERSSGLAEIYFSTPLKTTAIVLGKVLGLFCVVAMVLAAVLAANLMAFVVQGQVSLSLAPFALTWGLLLLPTFLVWISFVLAVWSLTGSRVVTYTLGLVTFGYTLYKQFVGEVNWLGNWILWNAVRWTDMGPFQLDRKALVMNRAFVVLLAIFLLTVAVHTLARRERDGQRLLSALRPRVLIRPVLGLALLALPALAVGGALWHEIERGPQGPAMDEKLKDYWRKNVMTWKDRPVPGLDRVDLKLDLEPASGEYRVQGTYLLINHHDEPLAQIPLTPGFHWRNLRWTLNGQPHEPDDRAGLAVFDPEVDLAPGDRITIGFSFEATYPPGTRRNGGGSSEFVLPAGVVLDNFLSVFEDRSPTLVPFVGYRLYLGVDEDNHFEDAEYPENLHQQVIAPKLTPRMFDTRIEISGPAEYTYNSVGMKVSDNVTDGRRRVVWESDHPVRLFNVVAGRWAERRGEEGTVVYYHPRHTYNLDEIIGTLDAARRYYSEWFAPYPWRELKLSEFPNLTANIGGAGMPTNITFSENAGFLTRNDVKNHAAFMVTAHEAAHQWWANILTPGDGPGGVLLAEGMAHFSTLLLFEQVKGEAARMEFAKRLEERYGNRRRVDMELPLVKTEMNRPGDFTLAYDKGAWVYWMLLQEIGRDQMIAGLQAFIEQWRGGPDHPLLVDFLENMRPFAEDAEGFDRMTDQWFRDVVVPEYRLTEASRRQLPAGAWEVTALVTNRGTGTMPVEVATVRGHRFDDEGQALKDYLDARTEILLAAGESRQVVLHSVFEPEGLVVDPDVLVLQLNRSAAVHRF